VKENQPIIGMVTWIVKSIIAMPFKDKRYERHDPVTTENLLYGAHHSIVRII
jgi:hypothetical protein